MPGVAFCAGFLGQRKADINVFGLFTFELPIALTVMIIFEIWRYFPLAMLFILARMQLLSSDIYEAAEIDGATPFQQFRFISFPQLVGIMAVLFLLSFIWTFNKSDDIFLLTGGAAGTRTLTVNVYEQAFAVSNLGAGAAVAVVVFMVVLTVASGVQPLGLGLDVYEIGQLVFVILMAAFTVQSVNLIA